MASLTEISLLPKLKLNGTREEFQYWKNEFQAFVDLIVSNKKDANTTSCKLLRYAIAGARISLDFQDMLYIDALKMVEEQVNVMSKPPFPLASFVETIWSDEPVSLYVQKLKSRAHFLSHWKARDEIVKQHLFEQLRPEIRAIVSDLSLQEMVIKLSP